MIKEVLKVSDWSAKEEFLQSWEYGDFLRTTGRNVVRYEYVSADNKEKIQFQTMITANSLGLKFVYIPRVDFSQAVFDEVCLFFKQKNFVFIRVERLQDILPNNFKFNFVQNRQPEFTWLLDLEKIESEILAEMHAKTRYNINLAKKKGVVSKMEKDIEKYWQLNQMTTERNSIRSHDKTYLENLLKLDNVFQINTYFENNILSSTILFKYNKTLYYLFGASSNSQRNLMAPYLNQFEAIKFAKTMGCKIYDFWGMAAPAEKGTEQAESHHNYSWQKTSPLSGVAKFKAGFGGSLKQYPKAVEIILHPFKYKIFVLIQKLRKQAIVGYSKK